jgi:hypothetical protein
MIGNNLKIDRLMRRIRRGAIAATKKSAKELGRKLLGIFRDILGKGGSPAPRGSPPARKTGALQGSVQVTDEANGYKVTLTTNALFYGAILDKNNHPFVNKAKGELKKIMPEVMKDILRKELKKAFR